ncbi:MAG TPA: BTAD domain-containing putative transcriptional regulator, partial [Acidimicrobiia bacterium]|nr:BTAD domain-containing putative transcriptional regulator [Acidimicrobiia bacterium]
MGERTDVSAMHDGGSQVAALEIALLGPLTITRAGAEIDLSGPKRRALLIFMALNVATPVSRDRIVEALWPMRQTGREEATLQVHISHLRDQLEPNREGPPRVLVTRDSAYMLAGEFVSLDNSRFDHLTSRGRAVLDDNPAAALEMFNEALGLWRGRPLQDVEYEDFAQDEIRRLELNRTEAIENRAEALVELNRDAEAIADLEALIRADPTRERPASLLMRALYRTGRQAEALRVFRRHSRQLSEQGLEPSPGVSFLEERILQHDPSLLPEKSVSSAAVGPGSSIRGYELRELAGSGSVGMVYRAFQASVGREVAVKVVHRDLAQSPEFVRRFSEGARLIAALEHPHIVPLHDFWREPGGAFLVMRWMDGGSLEGRLRDPWELDELGRVFDQLAAALGFAHSAGVVHRDVNPANVLFDKQGNAYLSDFRLAVTGVGMGGNAAEGLPTIEWPHAPPELVRGEAPTVASDIYSLGALLAEAISGKRYPDSESMVPEQVGEVVSVATA